ncbi:MAG: hypothetical protein R3272_06105 [Candidatus Promineifilaceae bacterium]|nr:hypothetical protein [Candidatus Promineifilaceae bacterium]
MSEAAVEQRRRFWKTFENPVTVKELRSRMRGRRAFVVLTIYLLVMSGLIALLYTLFAAASAQPYGPQRREAGRAVFAAVLGIQVLLVAFITPAFTAGAISGEKERQTYNLLRTTLLPARALVSGKLFSALAYIFLLLLAAVPLQSIAFLLGGVSPIELIISELLIFVSAVVFALLGLFFSSLMRSTLAASVTTFASSLLLTMGLPAAVMIVVPLLTVLFAGAIDPLVELSLIYTALILASTNLPATLILSEMFLIQEDALFYFRDVIAGQNVIIVSPWMLYIVLYSLMALFLYLATVQRVRRIPR